MGLEKLQAILPSAGKPKNMSRLETLKQAVCYIRCLKTELIKSGDIPNFIPTENGDQNESLEASKDPYGTENNELVRKPGPENEPIHMDSMSETASSETEVGSVVLTSNPSQKTEAVLTSNPASLASEAFSSSSTNIALVQKMAPKSLSKDQNSTTSGMSDLEKNVMDPFDPQAFFENFVKVDNPPEHAVILNFDLKKFEESSVVGSTTSGSVQSISGPGNQYSVVGSTTSGPSQSIFFTGNQFQVDGSTTSGSAQSISCPGNQYSVDGSTTSGSAQSISGPGNQFQVAAPADTPQVTAQPGKRSILQTFLRAHSCSDSFVYS